MTRLLAVLATLAVGALIALQPPINSELGKRTSVLAAAFISTGISVLVLGLLALAFGEAGHVRRVSHIPVIYLTGGLMGAALVSVSLVTVRTLGAGGVVAATVSGQLVVSAMLDRYGRPRPRPDRPDAGPAGGVRAAAGGDGTGDDTLGRSKAESR